GRRRRINHRGALRSRSRTQRWGAIDVPTAVRSPDGGAADHRARDRAKHLSGTGSAPWVGSVVSPFLLHEVTKDTKGTKKDNEGTLNSQTSQRRSTRRRYAAMTSDNRPALQADRVDRHPRAAL